MNYFKHNQEILVIFPEWDEATITAQVGSSLMIDSDPPEYDRVSHYLEIVEEDGQAVWKTLPLSEKTKEKNLQELLGQIDQTTRENIARGFEYDGHTFSLSVEAQLNWNALKNTEGDPIEVSTKDNQIYSLKKEDIPAFTTAGRKKVDQHLKQCREQKVNLIEKYGTNS